VAHTASCGTARTPECRCGGCAGSQHGWTGALTLAQPAMVADRSASRAAAEHEWADASTSVPGNRLTRRKTRAAVAIAKADILDWMSTALADPSTSMPAAVDQLVEDIGDMISADVLEALCKALGSENQNKTRAELAKNHLFCSLLAALAAAMQKFGADLNKAIGQVTGEIAYYLIGRKRVKYPSFITTVVAQAAAKGISQLIQRSPIAQNLKHLELAIRILAIMMCPAPEKHEEVVRYCLEPLGEPIVSAAVQNRLKAVMLDWMK